jgi:NAD(P)H-flavin reductase
MTLARVEPFHELAVVEAWQETARLYGVRFDFGALGRLHTRPGQLVRLSAAGHESHFALANAPQGDGYGELLLKRGSTLSDAVIAQVKPGGCLRATAPFGDGFPVEEAEGRNVLLFAAGSGITPVRALLQYLLDRDSEKISLFYGQQHDHDFAYTREHSDWVKAGVHLVLCASQPSAGWHGARGYVQTVVRELKQHEISTENAVGFLCGMTSMIEAVRTELLRFGLPPERTFLNY